MKEKIKKIVVIMIMVVLLFSNNFASANVSEYSYSDLLKQGDIFEWEVLDTLEDGTIFDGPNFISIEVLVDAPSYSVGDEPGLFNWTFTDVENMKESEIRTELSLEILPTTITYENGTTADIRTAIAALFGVPFSDIPVTDNIASYEAVFEGGELFYVEYYVDTGVLKNLTQIDIFPDTSVHIYTYTLDEPDNPGESTNTTTLTDPDDSFINFNFLPTFVAITISFVFIRKFSKRKEN